MKIVKFQKVFVAAVAILIACSTNVLAQLKVGNNPSTLNSSAVLEVESTNKGFLPPRVALTSLTAASPLTAHVQGMIVYNTATTTDLTPGLYLNDGTQWGRMKFSGDTGGSQSGDFTSKGVPINANTPASSLICLGQVCIRYNGTDSKSQLQVMHTLPNVQFFHNYSYWGTTVGGTSAFGSSLNPSTWSTIYNFGDINNTEGQTSQLTMVDKVTGEIRSYTINANIIIASDSGAANDILFIRFYQN